MKDLNSKKNKHLTLDDRIEIQDCLNHGMSFKAIGLRIGKDQTTISKEIKKHISVNQSAIKQTDKEGNPNSAVICPSLLKSPFTCNPCEKRRFYCGFQKQYYYAKIAHREYVSLLTEAREGTPLNKEEFYEMDRIVSNGIKQGQHLYHIMQTNQLGVSKSTVYRHLKRGYLSVCSMDFPRVVKFKPRRQKPKDTIPKALKQGKTYDDFLAFIEENNLTTWVEMDTVIGRVGGKTILTFDFTFCNFMFGLLLEDKSALEVTEKISNLKANLNTHQIRFGDIFPLLLTDNGGEFANIFSIENDLNGFKESSLFFCDPFRSFQKPKVEKNHTLFRDIVPTGSSFDNFSQSTVNLIFSHVNSVKRKSLNGKTPFEMFSFTFGELVPAILGIKAVPAAEVIQSPKLLKQ